MRGQCHRSHGFLISRLRLNTDTSDCLPREPLLNQEFGLFPFLAISPLTGLHRVPVDLVQVVQIAPIFKIAGAGIRERECPM